MCCLALTALAHCGQPDPGARDGAPVEDARSSSDARTTLDDGAPADAVALLDTRDGSELASDSERASDARGSLDVSEVPDSGPVDTGADALDAAADTRADSAADAPRIDGGLDAGAPDGAPRDAAVVVADVRGDTVSTDTARPDAGGCLSGAEGSRALRVQWYGSAGSSSSTAAVRYEANELPDRSRWRVTPNSRSIGYRPVFTDVFLGEGGLELSGTGFIDVELSTAGLASISRVTVAVYGRSFNTTASGSFRWQTFDGTGAAPANLVANSAPYEWYGADATDAFTAGDDGVLLRIYPGPSSGALIVNRLEVCFDAL